MTKGDAVALGLPETRALANALIPVAHNAGAAIMAVYASPTAVRYKADRSPVTNADNVAEDIILQKLHTLFPGIPVIAEEQAAAGIFPDCEDALFLVDPLDGTKDFIARTDEFTVNIGLVVGGKPCFGLIFAPALDDCYVTVGPGEAVRLKMRVSAPPSSLDTADSCKLDGGAPERAPLALVSRSNHNEESRAFLRRLPDTTTLVMGSSLKFCALARGDADIYARFGPTSEWDTAAGHAILEAASGAVVTHDDETLLYGKRELDYINPGFIAWRRYRSLNIS